MPEIRKLQLSPASEFLDKAEMRQLTGRAQVNVQALWLEANEVPHRRDGQRLIVSRYHVREWLEGKESRGRRTASSFCWNVPGMNGYDPTKPPDWDPTEARRGAEKAEADERLKSFRGRTARIAVLWTYYAELSRNIPAQKLACPEFHRIATEGRASMHFAKCEACRALRAQFFPARSRAE